MMKFETRRPCVWVCLIYASGILCSSYVPFRPAFLGTVEIILLALIVLTFKRSTLSILLIGLSIFTLSMIQMKNARIHHEHSINNVAKYYRQKPIQLKAKIITDIQNKKILNTKKISFTAEVSSIKAPWGWEKGRGKILVHLFKDHFVKYGDVLLLEGKLHKPFNFGEDGGFGYKEYLNRRGINYILSVKNETEVIVIQENQGLTWKATSLKIRSKLKSIFAKYLTKNEAGIIQAMIIGDRSLIPKHIKELFVRTGTIHILAISGLHVGVVVMLILILLKMFPLGRVVQFVCAIVLIVAYIFLTGARPSVIRAVLMAVVFLTSYIFEKNTDLLNSLSLAAIILLLINPFHLFDVGFQLSFACVLSIVLFSDPIREISSKVFPSGNNRLWKYIHQSLSVSLAVWIGIMGLIAFYFRIVTPITVIANLFIIPLLVILVALGFGLLLSGYFGLFIASYFALCLKSVLNLLIAIIYIFEKVPLSYIYLENFPLVYIAIYYSILSLIVLIFFQFWKSPSNKENKQLHVL